MRYLFSVLLLTLAPMVLADTPPTPQDCLASETVDGYTLLTNKCNDTINLVWFYEGVCSTGCSDKLVAKYHKYVSLLKTPYTMSVCIAPKETDPAWKGVGQPSCK